MSTSTDFKILEIPVDGVNSYIPPIIINEADNNGRRLKFTPTYEGQPVTGITSARMYYDPRPRDASSIGDYVDGTKDGDGWVFILPPNTFTANEQGIASVSFTDTDGETYTRSMPIDVEPGGTKADSQGTRIDRLVAILEQMVNDFTLTAAAKTGPAGSKASVNVTKLGNGSYNLDFTIPKGDKGDTTTAINNVTASVDNNVGTPSVDVTHNGPSNAVNIDFKFHNLKGTHNGVQVWVGWEDPTVQHDSDVMDGDLWLKSPHYLTDLDPDNPTEGASTAEYYTYAQGEEDNSPSVLIRTGQVVTDLLEYWNGAWWSLIWRVESSLTPGKQMTQKATVANTLPETKLLTRIEALEAEVKSLRGVE